MNEETAQKVLTQALEQSGVYPDVQTWLAQEEIPEPVFKIFLEAVENTMSKRLGVRALVGAGFNVGWMAHKIMLATPVETGPPPDLSDSLE